MKRESFDVKSVDGPVDHRGREVLPVPIPNKDSPRRRQRRFPWKPLIALVVLTGIGLTIWRVLAAPPEVLLAPAEYSDLNQSFTAEAVVKGKDYEVASEVMGRVTVLHVRDGSLVSAGQALVELEPDDTAQSLKQALSVRNAALANYRMCMAEVRSMEGQVQTAVRAAESRVRQAGTVLRRAKAGARPEEVDQAKHVVDRALVNLEEKTKAYARAKNLVEAGAISRAMFDAAEAAYRAGIATAAEAKSSLDLLLSGPRPEDVEISRSGYELALAELAAARSKLGEVEVRRSAVEIARANLHESEASIQRVKIQMGRQVLRAPASGTVTKLNIEAGGLAVIGQPLIRISTTEDLRIEAEISSEDISKVRVGMAVRVTSAAYPGKSFPARVIEVMPVGELKPDAAIRIRIVRARVMLITQMKSLKPGMELDVEGETLLKRVLVVPSDALVISGGSEVVYLVQDGIVVEKNVTTGLFDARKTEVLSGLKEGEMVIVHGKDLVTIGSRVTVRH